jgi:hypothetical protein
MCLPEAPERFSGFVCGNSSCACGHSHSNNSGLPSNGPENTKWRFYWNRLQRYRLNFSNLWGIISGLDTAAGICHTDHVAPSIGKSRHWLRRQASVLGIVHSWTQATEFVSFVWGIISLNKTDGLYLQNNQDTPSRGSDGSECCSLCNQPPTIKLYFVSKVT